MMKNWWKRAAALVIAVLAVSVLTPATAEAAPPRGIVKVRTQRMTEATLNRSSQVSQVGWYNAGRRLDLTCYKRGQRVTGYYGGPSNLWYLTADGYYVADIDMDTGSNDPVTRACPPTARIDLRRSYTITSRNSPKVIDVRNGSASNGAAIQQYAANNSRAQSFKFVPTGGGFYRIVSDLKATQVWDAAGARRSNGTRIVSWTWGGPSQAHQQWMPVVTSGGYVTFRPRHAYPSMCLDVPWASKSNSVQLQLYSCNGSAAQQWRLMAKPVPTSAMDRFVAKYNGAKNVTSVLPGYPWPGECTSFVTRYLQEVQGVTLTGWKDAHTWARERGDTAGLAARGFVWHAGGTPSQNGDILVWSVPGPTGHVGLWYNDQVFDQNRLPHRSHTVGLATFDRAGYLGYWRRG